MFGILGDRESQTAILAGNSFRFDVSSPTAGVVLPANNARYVSMAQLSGTAADTAGDDEHARVAHVDVTAHIQSRDVSARSGCRRNAHATHGIRRPAGREILAAGSHVRGQPTGHVHDVRDRLAHFAKHEILISRSASSPHVAVDRTLAGDIDRPAENAELSRGGRTRRRL